MKDIFREMAKLKGTGKLEEMPSTRRTFMRFLGLGAAAAGVAAAAYFCDYFLTEPPDYILEDKERNGIYGVYINAHEKITYVFVYRKNSFFPEHREIVNAEEQDFVDIELEGLKYSIPLKKTRKMQRIGGIQLKER